MIFWKYCTRCCGAVCVLCQEVRHLQSCSSPNCNIDVMTMVMVIMRMVLLMITPAYGESANLKGRFFMFMVPCIADIQYISNCPTRCNTKQSIYYSTSSLYMFRVSTTPIIRSTQNCNYSLRYWSYFFVQLPPSIVAKIAWWPCGMQVYLHTTWSPK